jgi:transposase
MEGPAVAGEPAGPRPDPDERIAALSAENLALREEVRALRATIAQLQERIRELEARVKQNSRSSSRPPSSDLPSVPPRSGRRSGRRPGGQPGHPGQRCAPVPREEVDHVVDCWAKECAHCRHPLPGAGDAAEQGPPVPYQVQDVRIERVVTQYDQHRVACPRCGRTTLGPLPAGVAHSQYGPGVTALVALCSGVFQLARREVARLCQEIAGIHLSVGSVQKLCEEIGAGLAGPVEELTEAIRRQPAVGVDETGWRDCFQRRYLWRVGCPLGSIFKIGTRAAEVGQSLLGATFSGCAMTDRYGGHNWLSRLRRQFCWAHLKRDGQALVDLAGAAAGYGKAICAAAHDVFRLWDNFRAAGKTAEARRVLQAGLVPVQERLRPVLQSGCRSRNRKVVNLCRAMLEGWESLWLFSVQEGIEPTNNDSERDLRRAVLWRRRSLGTHSPAGAAFVERMLAVSSTCRRQARSSLIYLVDLADALRSARPAPSLLPPVAGGALPAVEPRMPSGPAQGEAWPAEVPPDAAAAGGASLPAAPAAAPAEQPEPPAPSGAAHGTTIPVPPAPGVPPARRATLRRPWARGHPPAPVGASP